jgi:spore germination protein KA
LIREAFAERLLQSSQVGEVEAFDDAWTALSNGRTLVLFDGDATALSCDTQRITSRNVEEPANETVIRGPRFGFIESIGANMALLRQIIKTPNLWFEEFTLGHLTRTKVSVAYIKGLASEELVQEVRQRVGRIEVGSILESGYIEELVEDDPFTVFPLVFRTERPDRVAACLLEGRVAVFTENTSFVLVVPMDFPMLLQAPDDYYEKVPIGSALRILRYIAFLTSILLPGVYVGIMTFHQELVTTELLLRITAAREGVPFPVVAEVLTMELLFELLREAGIRLPRAIGPAVSIVGALVLGEAAINAGFVSPAVVIVVALTAISSFTVPTFSFGIAARLARFVFILLGGTLGLFGIQFGVLALLTHLVGVRSFGHPFIAPVAPLVAPDLKDLYVRTWHWDKNMRPLLLGAREPVRVPRGQQPRPGIDKEQVEKARGRGGRGSKRR